MKTVKIGVIGCGGIANNKHMPAYTANKKAELVAFCDIVEERAIKANEKFGNENTKYYTDYKELLKDKSIDAVLVLTHNAEHCRITVDALNAGKHVLCEKPMAMNFEEKQQCERKPGSRSDFSVPGTMYRFGCDDWYRKYCRCFLCDLHWRSRSSFLDVGCCLFWYDDKFLRKCTWNIFSSQE